MKVLARIGSSCFRGHLNLLSHLSLSLEGSEASFAVRLTEKGTAASTANAIRSKMLHREVKPSSSATTTTVRGNGCNDEEPAHSAPVTRSAKIRFRKSLEKSNPTPEDEPPAKKPNPQSKCAPNAASPETASVAKKYFLRGTSSKDAAKGEQGGAEVPDDVDDLMTLLAMYKELPDGGYVCQLCESRDGINVLQDKPQVVRHVIRSHGFSHAHECPSCPSSFKRESWLASHVDALHKNEKLERDVECARCPHRSKDDTLLRLHVLRKHVAVCRYVCSCCGKCFRTWAAKSEHERLAGFRRKPKTKFECDKCQIVTKTKDDLERHIKDVHSGCHFRMIYRSSKLQYKCLICTKIFVSKKSFHEHAPCNDSPAEGNEVEGFLCSECGKRLSSKDHLKKHARVHSGERPYPCPECGQTFALRNTMRIHALSHCGIKPYVCEICRFNYSQRSALMIHWKSKHKGMPPPPPVEIHQYFDANGQLLSMKYNSRLRNNSSKSRIRVRTTSELTNTPQVLGTRSTSPRVLKKATKAMPKITKVTSKRKNSNSTVKCQEEKTADVSPPPNKKAKVVDLPKQESQQKEEQKFDFKKLKDGGFGCTLCFQKFSHRYKVKQHLKLKHEPREIITCDDCGKKFKSKYQFNTHANQHRENSNDYLFCCDKCDYRAKSKHYLKTHVIRKHTTEYKFECAHCDKRFKMKMDLKFHLGTHGTSQHMCDACGRMYSSQDSLHKHRRVVHLNDYKFQCDICHQKLLTEANYKSHLEAHKNMHSCDECDLKFTKKYYVTRHKKRVHKVEKTNLCRVCGKAFVCMATLRVHYLTHVKIKPYLCNVCGYSFTQRSSMMLHWKRKHPDAEEPPPPVILTNFFDSIETEVDKIAEKNNLTDSGE